MTMTHFPWTADMPLVRVTINMDTTVAVWVCGIHRRVPDELCHVERMGSLLDHLYDDVGAAFTVEIIDPDGTTRTGMIDLSQTAPTVRDTPTQCVAAPLVSEQSGTARRALASHGPDALGDGDGVPVVIRAAGFLLGEPVTVALVAAHTVASSATGDVTAHLSRQMVDGDEVILVGEYSGHQVVHNLVDD
jgi:hypothetical protein